MASEFFRPTWAWASGTETRRDDGYGTPSTDGPTADTAGASETTSSSPGPTPTRNQRHYKPRTCRICLEVVNPSTEIDDSLAGRVFSSRARVRYVSEDPELGRLLSPCKCKGSQKYVHEGCLRAWRNAAPLSDRNYWRCPTCQFEYRLERLRWSRWISSKLLRAALTFVIMVVTIFVLGFIADPIIDFWVDPLGSIAETLFDGLDLELDEPVLADYETSSWSIHFLKGFLSLGLLGFLKSMFILSPWNWFNIRLGGGRGRRRDRMQQVNWALVVIGVVTFLGATWKFVSHICAKTLEKASDRVMDVQEDGPDEDDEDEGPAPRPESEESRKNK
ncbi:uncharacterized protein THITE_2058495 [Thermothielavioides terrestris NRRL 8126]|uniref:RING-CH-type domain-containing protein n=1 Tax=Thermothielavioides terrestris (strain ATCC 38088 / NRRL 8126) TaxID=578455 RepID=G2RFW7_THETT|nr:uncharacterized protein THITE_2058495 [Thermothielavioides terrestris NRRL 8126]AEO71721.1 hypothetical protein THITE_2058495 [Thermothielavioides terrestris NRRL 8126]